MNILHLLGRDSALFTDDIISHEQELSERVQSSRFLVIGAAGSIGKAVTKEIFKRSPLLLHVVDISENNLVELVRDIRSSLGYIKGEFKTFAIDCGSIEYELLMRDQEHAYDYVLNLSALKHVRSEKDPYTLLRLIRVNILNTLKTHEISLSMGAQKYFCVSTDKAANPVNLMGGSKKIMEMFLMRASESLAVSTARFANVAFSDGSLLFGFNQRILQRQPLSAPNDVKRYFVTPSESGELCLMSCLLGNNRDIFFPKLSPDLHLTRFSDVAQEYICSLGYQPHQCDTEEEARELTDHLIPEGKWPCYFFTSDTSGEKDFEEFFTEREDLDLERYKSIGVIRNDAVYEEEKLQDFVNTLAQIESSAPLERDRFIQLFNQTISNFNHKETGKFLDDRM